MKDTYAKRIVTTNGSRNNIDPFFIKENYIFEEVFRSSCEQRKIIKEQVVCGYTCLDNDRIMKIYDGKELIIGDKLSFRKVGAYTICLTPLFIESFPNVYLKREDDSYMCIRKRWDVEDFIRGSVF